MDLATHQWYAKAPVALQTAIVTAYGAASRLARNGPAFHRALEELAESEWMSEAEWSNLQDRRLRELVAHCYEHVPYYRRVFDSHGISASDIATTADLQKLPILTKDEIRRHRADLVSDDAASGRTYIGMTSGTTGTPMEYIRDERSVIQEQAFIWRHWKLAGLPLWGRRATLRGDAIIPVAQTRPPYWRMNAAENQLVMSSFHLSRASVPEYVGALERFKPVALQAYPSSIYYLAQTMLELGLRLSVPLVFTASEPVYPKQRTVIEDALGCSIFDFYGQAERVVFAMECCEHAGMHIAPEYGVAELVEPEGPHPAGTYEIVGTGLLNRAMPLIRYRTGDLTRELETTCACGRSTPKITSIETRAGDLIVTPDGRFLTFAGLTHAFMGLSNMTKSQLIQDAADHVLLRIVPSPEYADSDGAAASARLSDYFGDGIRIDVELVDDIAREKSGKYRWIVSLLNPADWEQSND